MIDNAMDLALSLAREAAEAGEVPVGAVIIDEAGEVVASARNRTEEDKDPTAHAEMLAIRQLSSSIGRTRLPGHTLVVTLEPCAMCAMAAVWARFDRVVYGAADPKAGAMLSLYNIGGDKRLNHRLEIIDGVRAEESAALLSSFFRRIRERRR